MRALKVLLMLTAGLAGTAPLAQEALNAELREQIVKVDVTLSDLYSRSETRPLVITIFRPPGEGKFPLLILNHGRAVDSKRHLQGRQRYLSQARWFVERGFVVMVPTRVGYGETFSNFDPEDSGRCQQVRLEKRDEALLTQTLATYEFAKKQDFVDTTKWVVAGQSVGGYAAITVARRAPEGLVGAINFAGGYGGDPEKSKGNSCSPYAWEDILKKRASPSSVPTLWVYWKNDWYWGGDVPKRWFDAFKTGGGVGEFVNLAEIKGDGHSGFTRDQKNWSPIVQSFLGSLPLQLPKVSLKKPTPTPPPSGFALVEDLEKVPFIKDAGKEGYKNFLTKEPPRAFAINSDGKWGWSSGHADVTDRALGFCNKNAKNPCSLYAVDEDVVWKP